MKRFSTGLLAAFILCSMSGVALAGVTSPFWNGAPSTDGSYAPFHVCCDQNDPAENANSGACSNYNSSLCHDTTCGCGTPGCTTVATNEGNCHPANASKQCTNSGSWYGFCTPEMSDYLALALVGVVGLRIYYFRRRSLAA